MASDQITAHVDATQIATGALSQALDACAEDSDLTKEEMIVAMRAALEAVEMVAKTPVVSGNVIEELFAAMSESQRHWQDEIGFGEEGNRLREAVVKAQSTLDDIIANKEPLGYVSAAKWSLEYAQSNLRNYYLAKLALITTEVAEAIEEVRNGHAMDETYYPTKGSSDSPFEKSDTFGPFKPEGVPSELADVVIRIWSLCGEAGIDLGPMIVEKLKYNMTRAKKHGGKAI